MPSPADTMALQERARVALLWRWMRETEARSLLALADVPQDYFSAEWWQIPKAFRVRILFQIENVTDGRELWLQVKAANEL